MNRASVALFHPGDMGSAIGACLSQTGVRVRCALALRSESTRARAASSGLQDAGTMQAAIAGSDMVLSVCPPHAALQLAREVAACGFKGLYVDANAVSPATARTIAGAVEAGGARFVDAGIIGPPPRSGRSAWMYLCGPHAAEVAPLFAGTATNAEVLDGPIGAASALKACYAAWNKGTWLFLASLYALAEREGVAGPLRDQWARSHPQLLAELASPSVNPAKAWRWLAEMQEIAATFESAGQPGGFAGACAEICRRLEGYKDDPSRPSIEAIVPSLQGR